MTKTSDQDVLAQIEGVANELAQKAGCRIYDIEFGGSPSGRVLRIFIDHQERPVGIEDCSIVSRALNEWIDSNDPIAGGEYTLEVSSPGLERHLKKPWHFESSIGKKVKLKSRKSLGELGVSTEALKGQRMLKEVIKSADALGVSFEIGGETVVVPYESIDKAQLIFEYGSAEPRGKK